MNRQRQARQSRNSNRLAQDVPLPLPTSGLFVDARTAEISGLYASRLQNFRTDGISLELRKQQILGPADQLVLQRVPFAFGAVPRYINLRSNQAECLNATLVRQFDGNAMVAYVSSQAIIVDGLDLPIAYNGTAFNIATFTTSTTVNADAFDGCIAHNDRLFFWRTNGVLEFYYGGLGAVTGALTRFPLDRLGNITGNILTMASLTLDAGQNSNDALAIYTTSGQIVIYEGLDPGDANDWGLSTRLQVAPPLSRFGVTRVGADVWVMTTVGIVSMADSIQRGSLALVNAITRPIADDILDLAARNPTAEWQLHTTADGSQIIINFYTPAMQQQFIWQIDSKAWATADHPARLWHNLALKTDFTTAIGRLGTVALATDPVEAITAIWHTGWFQAGMNRTLLSITPTIIATGPLTVKITVLRDYSETAEDVAESQQIVTIEPEDAAGPSGRVALNEMIPVGIAGSSFQLRMEVTATWAQIVKMAVALA